MISKIRIRNFKSFADVELALRHLTLLSGVNGSGKSTVLQALGVVKQSYDAGYLCAGGGLLLNGEIVELGIGKDVLSEHADSQEVGIEVSSEQGVSSWRFGYAETHDLLPLIDDPSVVRVQPNWVEDGFQFLKADRIAPAVVYPKSYNESIRHRFLGVRGQYVPYFLSVSRDDHVSEGRIRVAGTSPLLLDQINSWLNEISPGASVSASEINGADLAQLLFRYGGSAGIDSSNNYRPTNVGFGLTYVLPIIAACLSARRGDLILLENPEAHLHPRGQTAMGELIALASSDGVQVVVESHSDHLLNGIRLSVKRGTIEPENVSLLFCRKKMDGKGSEFISPSIDSSGKLSEWPEGFFDEWERSLMELV